MVNRHEFYRTKDWEEFRAALIAERLSQYGEIICERCGKPIVNRYDLILHHITMLNERNYQDASVALNPKNIMMVHHKCHNEIHGEIGRVYGNRERFVWLVYGSPLSGKSTYVSENIEPGDLVVDIDRIWECVSGQQLYIKPKQLNPVVFAIRDHLIDLVRTRTGTWCNAWIIGGYPMQSERERLCKELGAREIYIDTPKDICLARAEEDPKRKEKWIQYINTWWEFQK